MFVLPALIFPLVFVLAIYRLVQIPRRLLSGELQLPSRRRFVLWAATASAYLVLLSYTIALSVALFRALFFAEDQGPAYLSLLIYVAAYPIVYVGAAWVFYYGLRPGPAVRHLPH